MNLAEAIRFSFEALRANKVRTFLTALGLVIGNASVILVVTISITSRDYILDQIRAIGSNLVYAYYEAGNNTAMKVEADFIKWADVEAVREQLAPRRPCPTIVGKAGRRIERLLTPRTNPRDPAARRGHPHPLRSA